MAAEEKAPGRAVGVEYMSDEKAMRDILQRHFGNNPYSVEGSCYNKNGEKVFVVLTRSDRHLFLYLYSLSTYRSFSPHPMLSATVYCDEEYEEKYVRLDDILPVENGVGNGSILMYYFLNYCIYHTDALCVTGMISSVDTRDNNDRTHESRLRHFYEKHGFKVTIDENGEGKAVYTIERRK